MVFHERDRQILPSNYNRIVEEPSEVLGFRGNAFFTFGYNILNLIIRP